MATTEERTQYQTFANEYANGLGTSPQAAIEAALVRSAMGPSLSGATVLDLGGGSGIHARRAIDAGASSVDLVDISSEMVRLAQAAEDEAGRKDDDAMRFFIADATTDLSKNIGLRVEGYDVVMVNWLLDHATCEEDLHAFWRNIARFTKPGGRYLGVRMANYESESCTTDCRYGVKVEDVKGIPGGVRYKVIVLTEPRFEFEATSMEKSFSGSTVMHEKYGFDGVSLVDPEGLDVVRQNPEFWNTFVEDPYFVCEVATKKEKQKG